MRQLVLEISPQPAPTFGNFVTGRNEELVAKLKDLSGGIPRRSFTSGARTDRAAATCSERQSTPPRTQGASWFRMTSTRSMPPRSPCSIASTRHARRAGTLLAASQRRRRPSCRCGKTSSPASPGGWSTRSGRLRTRKKPPTCARRPRAAGLRIADEVIWYLLAHVRRDLPTLVAILAHLDEYSLSRQRPLTAGALVRETLKALEE